MNTAPIFTVIYVGYGPRLRECENKIQISSVSLSGISTQAYFFRYYTTNIVQEQ